MANPKSKLYLPIWERLKNRDKCVLSVAPGFLPRVKKAIIKEKNKDLAFKMLNESEKFVLSFSYDREKLQLTVVLKQRFGLEGKVV